MRPGVPAEWLWAELAGPVVPAAPAGLAEVLEEEGVQADQPRPMVATRPGAQAPASGPEALPTTAMAEMASAAGILASWSRHA
jgi:hypothetical protein